MSLIYRSNFWEFYNLNAPEIERILGSITWKYRNVMDIEDLRQEVIVRLERHEFLNTYDSSKTQIHTWFTNTARQVALHVITYEHSRKARYPQVFVQELNASCSEDDMESIPDEMMNEIDLENKIDYQGIYEEVKRRLSPTDRRILDYRQKGLKIEEIGAKLDCSFSFIQHKCEEIKELFIRVSKRRDACLPVAIRMPKNGHRPRKVRDLRKDEKVKILKKLFLPNNGQISADLCVAFKKNELSSEISVFQVTGYCVGLHNKAARGEVQVRDKEAYDRFIQEHRAQWATYKSEKYQGKKVLQTA